MNAGCHEPVGVYARMEEGKLIIQAAGCPGELKDKKGPSCVCHRKYKTEKALKK